MIQKSCRNVRKLKKNVKVIELGIIRERESKTKKKIV